MLPTPPRLRVSRNQNSEPRGDTQAIVFPPALLEDNPFTPELVIGQNHNTTMQHETPAVTNNPETLPVEDASTDDTELLRGIGSGAQVWTTYVREANDFDNEQVDGWNRSLDVTLVFAALFSAILTAFVLESVQALQPDPAEITASTLVEISRVLQGIAAGQPLVIETSNTSNGTDFQPTRNSIWVNILWFFSLSLSVAVSLAAMLAKQWCYYFLAGRTGDDITQAKLRHSRFSGIAKWRMRGILEMLPILMHISLAVFSVGLVLFLWDINVAVATTVTVVSVIAMCFYLVTTVLPVRVPFCPFQTPQAEYMRAGLTGLQLLASKLWSHIRVQNDPNSLGNKPRYRVIDFLSRKITTWFSSATTSDLSRPARPIESDAQSHTSARQPDAGSPSAATAGEISVGEESQFQPFVKESLSWLIKNSQNSRSIDIAIGALAIGKVDINSIPPNVDDLKTHVNSHLVKHFSDCFKSYKGRGIKLHLLENRIHIASNVDYTGRTHAASALDYSSWMTYFADSTIEGITIQISNLRRKLGIDLVTHLGLAFASLSESKEQLPDDSKNIGMWLSAFISLYDSEKIYFNEPVVSAMVDGLTAVTLKMPSGSGTRENVNTLAVPQLIKILWKVSHLRDSSLRSSIGLNLAIFALKSKMYYPFDQPSVDSSLTANQLAAEYRSKKISLMDEGFAPFVMLLLGFLHPNNNLGLDEGTITTIYQLIHEPRFFLHPQYRSPPGISRIAQPDSFRRHMATMMIESMISNSAISLDGANTGKTQTEILGSYYLQMASMAGIYGRDQVFSTKSTLHATCQLIYDHLHKRIVLYPDVLAAATNLLLREVKELKGLSTGIIYSSADTSPPVLSPVDFGWPHDPVSPHDSDTNAEANTRSPFTPEFVASAVLALIMSESTDKQCIEAAVRAALHHSSDCNVDLVLHAIAWFASKFPVPQAQTASQEQLLSVSGYIRVLTSMIMHCPDPQGLADGLNVLLSNDPDKAAWEARLRIVGEVLARLTGTNEDNHIYAFGVAGLAVWNLQIIAPITMSSTKDSSASINAEQLSSVWNLLSEHSTNGLRPEAIEALIDTTVSLSAFKEPVPKISSNNIRITIGLLDRFHSEPEPQVRPALAVALAFWGLSFEDHDWDFWTHEQRKNYWVEYSKLKRRTKDVAPLFLLGLSRILAHYSLLELNHASIRTIGREIDHFMKIHSSDQANLTLYFLPEKFDVRRHVRESVWEYLQETDGHGPFTKSASETRRQLSSAITSDGGEGYKYEKPQPFRKKATTSTTNNTLDSVPRPSIGPAQDSVISYRSTTTEQLGEGPTA